MKQRSSGAPGSGEQTPTATPDLEDRLRPRQIQVYSASSAEEARQKIQDLEVKPDLIITDYRLPQNKTGIAVVRHTREQLNCDIPGIILTGDVSPALRREAQDNCLQVLHKPADPDALLALIYQLLAGDEHPESTIVG